MKKGIKFLSILILSILILSVAGSAEEKSWPTQISIGAGTQGAAAYMACSAWAKIFNEEFAGKVYFTVEVTAASVHNLRLIQSDQVELGLSAPNAAWEAYNGKGFVEEEGDKPYDKIRGMIPGYGGIWQIYTLAKSNINNIRYFEGKSFSGLSADSLSNLTAKRIFGLFNINVNILNMSMGDSIRALQDGLVVGGLCGWPNPSLSQLDVTNPVKVVVLDEEQSKKFKAAYPQYVWGLTMPKETYRLQDADISTLSYYNNLYCSKDLPEDMVYEMIKRYYKKENEKIVESIWPQMVEGSKPENIIIFMNTPLHPGAVRYYKEQGIEIPENLMPPELK